MKYLLVGYLLNSLIISEHDSREACEGRAVMLRESKAAVQVKCVEAPPAGAAVSTGSTTLYFNGTYK